MTTTDRDLLILEPRLFNDLGFLSQRLFRSTTASIDAAGAVITDTTASPFDTPSLAPGHILLINAHTPVELLSITSPSQAAISRIRAAANDPAIPAPDLAGPVASLDCFTFAPQIALIRAQLLRTLGLIPGPTTDPHADLGEDRITDTCALDHATTLGALHAIYTAASPLIADPSATTTKALSYHHRFAAARRALTAPIDLDGDGLPDTTRRASTITLIRG